MSSRFYIVFILLLALVLVLGDFLYDKEMVVLDTASQSTHNDYLETIKSLEERLEEQIERNLYLSWCIEIINTNEFKQLSDDELQQEPYRNCAFIYKGWL